MGTWAGISIIELAAVSRRIADRGDELEPGAGSRPLGPRCQGPGWMIRYFRFRLAGLVYLAGAGTGGRRFRASWIFFGAAIVGTPAQIQARSLLAVTSSNKEKSLGAPPG